MNWKKLLYILVIIIVLVIVPITYKFFSTTPISNASISGWFIGNQIWSGNIYITGDVEILGNLTVLPERIRLLILAFLF